MKVVSQAFAVGFVTIAFLRFVRCSEDTDPLRDADSVMTTTTTGVSRESRLNRHLLVGYWGQNSAGPASGHDNYEKPLKDVCANTRYDILAVSFVTQLWDSRNKGELPGLNLANHCGEGVSSEYPSLLRCPKIEEGIKECQKLGKRVIMSIGGANGDGTLPSPAKAKELANTLFQLFLGGTKLQKLRPFGTAIMDGIDMDIEGGRHDNYPEFITELRRLMDADTSKPYLITAAPQCPFPDHYLGPVNPGTGLKEAGNHVDHLYIQFYNNFCHTGAGEDFDRTLKRWLDFANNESPKGPLIFIGVPAATKGASGAQYYRTPKELKAIYDGVKSLPGIGGIMLWDVSWDQNNVISGRRYSEHVAGFLESGPVTTATEGSGETTHAQAPTTSPAASTFSCDGRPDGLYAHPTDCSKFYQCHGGQTSEMQCPPTLLFNAKTKACDWPANVECP